METTQRFEEVNKTIEEDSARFSSMAGEYAKKITKHIDTAMQEAYKALNDNTNTTVSVEYLEKLVLNLSSLLYFVSDKVEEINIRDDVATATAKDAYEKAYLNASAEKDDKGKSIRTVAENQSLASQSSKEEEILATIYERASKIVRSKVDAGNEMVATIRKIITLRIKQMEQEDAVDRSDN